MDGQGTKWRKNISENFNRLSRAHERYRRQTDRQTTDGRTTTYSEPELEFTFAKKSKKSNIFLLFGAFFDDCKVPVADLLANLVLDSQLRRFSNRFVVRRICTEYAEYLGLCELTIYHQSRDYSPEIATIRV